MSLPESSVLEQRAVEQGPCLVAELGDGANGGMRGEPALEIVHSRHRATGHQRGGQRDRLHADCRRLVDFALIGECAGELGGAHGSTPDIRRAVAIERQPKVALGAGWSTQVEIAKAELAE